jgi:D-tagatose-1,6-bisphosphate aldolase subunit GatZ/KbaZ
MIINHPLKGIISDRKKGLHSGIYSVCSANEYVIRAAMARAIAENDNVLIESTANQVNQYGGYSGMKPENFRSFVLTIAKQMGLPESRVILGGDHLGPLTWKAEKSEYALAKSVELIRHYVLAGFTKIHIDTSMHLLDDNLEHKLPSNLIAARCVLLCKAAFEAYRELKIINKNAVCPVYVVGSEVPVPGGIQEDEELSVTRVDDFEETVSIFKKEFHKANLYEAWENVIAVVVQPGVEFGDDCIHEYDRNAAKELCSSLKIHSDIVFEGHSTDYQKPESLRMMVEDGIAILKVGPALTFALREALFALNHIENELFSLDAGLQPSNFQLLLDEIMVKNPENWNKYYHGSIGRIKYARKYSLSDRCRYYLLLPEVSESIGRMVANLKRVQLPLALISQFLPLQYRKVRDGAIKNDPESLIMDKIDNLIDDYYYAIRRIRNMC